MVTARIVLFVLFVLSAAPASPQSNATCADHFGVVDQLAWTFFYRSPEEVNLALDMMQDAGIGWMRLNWSWKDFQPEPGAFDFARFDLVAQQAASHDIQLLPILMGIPAWDSSAPPDMIAERGDMAPVDRYLPADLTNWLTYVSTVVERYDGDGTDDAESSPRIGQWEVWNEPNLALYWVPQPNAAEYVALLAATHDAIKAADDTALVVLGGLSGSGIKSDGTGFLQQVYDAGGADYFDVMSVHHYIHPTQGNIDQLRNALNATRAEMDRRRDTHKPLWLTEIGWSDAPDAWGLPTAAQDDIAAWLTEVYTADLPADKIFWYSFRNLERASTGVEDNFGLLTIDFMPKPAWQAYRTLARGC